MKKATTKWYAYICFLISSFLLIVSLSILISPFFWLIGAIVYGPLAIYLGREKKNERLSISREGL